MAQVDLADVLRRMANRDERRTEANIQSDLHTLLLTASLQLEEANIEELEVVLEQQTGARRRIDVEAGLCVFEVKRDLRKGNVRDDAVAQLAGYVALRSQAMNQRYVGVLTDGAEWHLYAHSGQALSLVSSFLVDSSKPDVEGLTIWLEGVLATTQKILPTPKEIDQRLGSSSPGHKLDRTELTALYKQHQSLPSIQLKRELWARLLTTAFGTPFQDTDELFIEHTLLVVTAEVIAHALMGWNPADPGLPAASILSGQLFATAEVTGVVESDFFDWIVELPGGERFVKELARRISRFAWSNVEHDVLKVLYESVISTAQRKKLGEYYTPDWLAHQIVETTVTDSLHQRVLDPSCGSGTFLFHAIRQFLSASVKQQMDNASTLKLLTEQVIGMDIHPVAVTFARVTYLLAIGPERLQAEDRPAIAIPVYLGDSIQWGQERTLFNKNALVIPTVGIGTELRFPERALVDAGRFDQLMSALADRASVGRTPGSPIPSLTAVFRRYAVESSDQPIIADSFKTLCQLHDAGRDHIWGYYVRNLARPFWMTRPEKHVDVLIGNPPWLSYRFMNAAMQKEFRTLSEERGLWAGASVATNQDLSALFILRSIERYLKDGGQFGFVMPWSVLRGRQFAGFRAGHYALHSRKQGLSVTFGTAWDLHAVKPSFFPVPACVVFGQRTDQATALPAKVQRWTGKLPQTNTGWELAKRHIEREEGSVEIAGGKHASEGSEYQSRFTQGATVVPRFLLLVEKKESGPLGVGAGRVAVQSRRSPNEKLPWKKLSSLQGNIERQFVRSMHLGETVLPYRLLEPLRSIVPWDGKRLLHGGDERLGLYPGLSEWWTRAEGIWEKHCSNNRQTASLLKRLDFHKGLSGQFPTQPYRVVYSKSGMYLAAAVVAGPAVIDHSLYWGTANSHDEARYLEAILNSDTVTQRIRPLQARGEHNPRHYDKYVWRVPIPIFNADDANHMRLVQLAIEAEQLAAGVSLPSGKKFETLRRRVREAIVNTQTGQEIEAVVSTVLGPALKN